MKILVTGASGEIGARLAQNLIENKHDVRLLSRSKGSRLSRWGNIDFHSVSLLDKEGLRSSMKGIDIVLNCAIDKTEFGTDEEIVNNNKICLKNLLDISKECKVKKFVELSSIAVLPPLVNQNVLNNHFIYSTENDWYTKAKIETEKLALTYVNDIDITIIRAGIVYGPYMHWSKLAFSRAQAFNMTIPDVANSVCHGIHVDDLVDLMKYVAFTEKKFPNLIYGINPERITWEDYFTKHGNAIGIDNDILTLRSIDDISFLLKVDGDELQKPGFKRSVIDLGRKTYRIIPQNLLKKAIYKLKAMNYGLISYEQYLNPKNFSTKQKFIPNIFEIKLYQTNAMPDNDQNCVNHGFKYKLNLSDGVKNSSNWWLLRF